MKKLIIVRHCSASGQESSACLTHDGKQQALALKDFFLKKDIHVDRIVSSPFERAVQSIKPFADTQKVIINTDERLEERILSTLPLPDWMAKLEESFKNKDLTFEGGESSNEAQNRAINLVKEELAKPFEITIIVTHGNLMTLVLNYFDKRYGFVEWKELSNPDVYSVSFHDKNIPTVERIWE